MDSNETLLSEPPADSQQSPSSVMDVMPPASSSGPVQSTSDSSLPPEPKPPEPISQDLPEAYTPQNHPKAPKPANKGNAVAITATVIIVLGLAALATYAYIKTR